MPNAQDWPELAKVGPFSFFDSTTDPDKVPGTTAVAVTNWNPDGISGALTLPKGRKKNIASASLPNAIDAVAPFVTTVNGLPALTLMAWAPMSLVAVNPANGNQTNYPFTGSYNGNLAFGVFTYAQYAGFFFAISSNPLFSVSGRDGGTKLSAAGGGLTEWQIEPPFTAPSDGGHSGTGLTGAYYWCYTFVNSNTGQESSHSPALGPINCANQGEILHNLGPGGLDPQITTINIYRIGGTSSSWTFVGSVPAGTFSFTDTTPDASLSGQTLIPHRDPPADFVSICQHKDRMWGFGQTDQYPFTFGANNAYNTTPQQLADLWFTRYAEPWSFDCVNNVLPLGRDTAGDIAVGLLSIGSVLLAFKTRTTWVVYGDSELDFRGVKLADVGCVPGSYAGGYGMGFWAAPGSGVWQSDGSQVKLISDQANTSIKRELDAIFQTPQTSRYTWTAAVYNRGYYLSNAALGITYVYRIFSGTWTKFNYATVSLAAVDDIASWTPLGSALYGVANDGVMKNLDNWLSQVGDDYLNPYQVVWQSGNFDSGQPHIRKNFRYATVKVNASDITNKVLVQIYVDGTLAASATLTPRSAGAVAGTGYSYYRISIPNANCNGHEVAVVITATCTVGATAAPSVSDVRVYGAIQDELPPPVPTLANGST